jgi:Uma2 family endonuclease
LHRADAQRWLHLSRCGTLAAMVAAATTQRMSAPEYLEWERQQTEKHEFHRGEVFAMAGGSLRHNFLSSAVSAELRGALRGKPCVVLSSDQRIAAEPGERYVYADAVVVCGGLRTEPGTHDVLANPSVIVEVLSPSTEAYDRGQKWEAYQRLASLTDYLLVTQTSARIEHFQRETDGSWRYRVLTAGDSITLANGARIDVDAIYEGISELDGG